MSATTLNWDQTHEDALTRFATLAHRGVNQDATKQETAAFMLAITAERYATLLPGDLLPGVMLHLLIAHHSPEDAKHLRQSA